MDIKEYTIEDVGIGLGLCAGENFIPISYAEGEELIKHLRRSIPLKTMTIMYEHPDAGLIEMLRKNAIGILGQLEDILC